MLSDTAISATGEGVSIDGSQATITSAGTYRLSGSLTDGRVVVDTKDKDVVRIILDGVELTNTTGAAISVANGEKVVIILAENSKNVVTDSANYVFDDPSTDEPNAAIFSKSDLTLFGSGSLTVNGNFNDGISSKDGLIIDSGTITVNAVDDGIRGKDYLVIKDGVITINASGRVEI